jgi:hypothetical protein
MDKKEHFKYMHDKTRNEYIDYCIKNGLLEHNLKKNKIKENEENNIKESEADVESHTDDVGLLDGRGDHS